MIKSPMYPGAGSHVQNTVPVIVKKKTNNRKPKNKNLNVHASILISVELFHILLIIFLLCQYNI